MAKCKHKRFKFIHQPLYATGEAPLRVSIREVVYAQCRDCDKCSSWSLTTTSAVYSLRKTNQC